jgi:hypothetical protein
VIRLGDSPFWLDATARGWVLVHAGGKRGKPSTAERFGPFTSPRHVLQQRQVAIPKEAQLVLLTLVDVAEAGEDLRDLPPLGEHGS